MRLAAQTEFSDRARKAIHKRDRETCVFCAAGYRMEEAIGWAPLQVMHVVPRSRLGMGVEENGALGCAGHHALMDNGSKGCRAEMQGMLEAYMRSFYPGWSREGVTFRKGGGAGSPGKEAVPGSRHPESGGQEGGRAGSGHDAVPEGFQRIAGLEEDIPI